MLSYLFAQIEYKKIHKERYLYQFIIYKNSLSFNLKNNTSF